MYDELVASYRGLPVVEFNTADDWQGPDKAYRLRAEYDDDISLDDRLSALLNCPDVDRLSALIIGAWSGACEGGGSAELVASLVRAAPNLPGLRALFLGEMTYEESELSWINQSDVGPLLQAFPRLESLRIRGGNGLAFTRTSHAALREIAIETGGLPRQALRELFQCGLPALEHLELLLGDPGYGFDGGVEDLQPALSGALYPHLKFLGLMNADIADEIAAVVVNAPVTDRIEVLDLSMGNLTDDGARALLGLAGKANVRTLNISHHFVSPELVEELRSALTCEVIADDPQSAEDEWRPILHAE